MADQPKGDPLEIVVVLSDHECQRAWAEGEWMVQNDLADGFSRHGDNHADVMSLTWWSVRGRAAELALCKWLGLTNPDLPLNWREAQRDHFDTPDPWALQVKSVARPNDGLKIGTSKRHCWECPYVLAYVPDLARVYLLGWATGAQVKRDGYAVRWGGGGSSVILPTAQLQAMNVEPGFRRGPQSICPQGRTAAQDLRIRRSRRLRGQMPTDPSAYRGDGKA